MVPDESDKVERYTGGLPDNIQGRVMTSKPKILQEEIELTKSLMDQMVHAYADRQVDNKRRMDNNSIDNNVQQPSYKRQNVAMAYSAGPSEKKEYTGTLPLCNKTRTVGIKLEVVKRVEGCMPWEEEKPTSPLSTLKMKPMHNERFSPLA
ncbi:hypothetical protein Tco_1124092 [Tanacetum coccineum]|uniref:Reverse transcriptase domain-containing protein n=1 Tax=Tanacetum coccineum TaxID=301880 RepID=A0ABQ5J574_9ASTR